LLSFSNLAMSIAPPPPAAVSELLSAGAQLDTPLLPLGARALVNNCVHCTGSTALHMAAAAGRASLVTTLLQAQQQRHPGLELRRWAQGWRLWRFLSSGVEGIG
jgi:ankyrin repeat protein